MVELIASLRGTVATQARELDALAQRHAESELDHEDEVCQFLRLAPCFRQGNC